MANIISHLYLKGGLGDTLPLGDVITTLREGVPVLSIDDAAVADNGNAIAMWTEVTPNTTPDQLAPWVARRVSGEWLTPERLVAPTSADDGFQRGRCVGIGTDGAFYAAVSGLSFTSRTRVYRHTGSGWQAVGGNLSLGARPFRLITRAGGAMNLFVKTSSPTNVMRSIRISGNTIGSAVTVGNVSGAAARYTDPIYTGTTGEMAAVLSFAVSSSTDEGASWTTSTDDPLSSLALWSAWMSQTGEIKVVHRGDSSNNVIRAFNLARRDSSGQWLPSLQIQSQTTSTDVSGLRVAGDWVVYSQNEAGGAQTQNATYARLITGNAVGPAIQLIKDPSTDGYRTSVDSISQYADGSYVGEMFTPSGLTYITNDGGQWNPRTVPTAFEAATGSLLDLSPSRMYSIGFVLASNDDASTAQDTESNLLVTVHRRPA